MATKKKTTAKKSPKKTASKAKTTTKKKVTVEKELIKKLNEIIKDFSEENLQFIMQQALVVQYNKQVDEINKTMLKSESKKAKAKNEASTDAPVVEIIEGENMANFKIVLYTECNFFSRDEMKKIVVACHAASDATDASNRLYAWFQKNRSDVIKNSPLRGPGDPVLPILYKMIIEEYSAS